MASPIAQPDPVSLWPNPVPLDCGVIRNQDKQLGALERGTGSNKFTLLNLKKVYNYLKTKGKGAFPNLRYSVWLHIMKNKFGSSEELAWMYFELFDVVSVLDPAERLSVLDTANKTSSQEELDSFRKKLQVDTTRFMLFLYVQSTPKLSLKTSRSTGDEWPSLESEGKQRFPESARVSFLKNNISELLELLSDKDELSGEKYVSVDALSALGFLICGSEDSSGVTSLESLALKYPAPTGYLKDASRFSVAPLEGWLRAHMGANPFGPQAVHSLRHETRLPCYLSDGPGRLLANTTKAPSYCRTAVLSRLVSQTLAAGESGLTGCDVHIRNCRRSSVYLLAPMRSVQVEKCSHCVLVLGAVESIVTVSNCDSITLVTAARKVHISSSSLCTFHLLTMTRPLIFPSCFHLCMAPYNTFYPALEPHLLGCGLSPVVRNHWDNPLVIGESSSTVWECMPPDSFRPLSVPFSGEGPTRENPCPLPQAFQKVLAARRESIQKWYDLVNKAQLQEDQSSELRGKVGESFQGWLAANGYDKEIAALTNTPKPTAS